MDEQFFHACLGLCLLGSMCLSFIALALGTVAPYLIEADAVPGQTTWPRGGQLRVDLPNNHLQYAFTWFGLAACLIGVFSVFAWRRLHDSAEPRAA